jgi:hypothetical protein
MESDMDGGSSTAGGLSFGSLGFGGPKPAQEQPKTNIFGGALTSSQTIGNNKKFLLINFLVRNSLKL